MSLYSGEIFGPSDEKDDTKEGCQHEPPTKDQCCFSANPTFDHDDRYFVSVEEKNGSEKWGIVQLLHLSELEDSTTDNNWGVQQRPLDGN